MRNLLAITLTLSVSANVFANELLLSTSAPTITITQATSACITGKDGNREIGCAVSAMTLGMTTTIALLKEDIQQVEPDAYAFLAGEEMSLALEEIVNEVRRQAPELQDSSTEEVVSLLLSSVQ